MSDADISELRLRHDRRPSRSSVRLLAGRQGQLRGRPRVRRQDRGRVPVHPACPSGRTGRSSSGPIWYLAGEAGIRQFLDIGTGLPTADNTHEVAQAVAPDSRIVYVDNDPIVLTHARALLTSTREGATAYIDADLRDPERILSDPDLHRTLDLSQPVGLVLLAILHFVDDSEDPHAIVARLVGALPPGSYLVMSHATYDPMPPEIVTRLKAAIAGTGEKGGPRDRDQFERFFTGLELVEPGIVPIGDWRPTPGYRRARPGRRRCLRSGRSDPVNDKGWCGPGPAPPSLVDGQLVGDRPGASLSIQTLIRCREPYSGCGWMPCMYPPYSTMPSYR